MSITMMQGDNENIKVILEIALFTDYLAIYMIYCCGVVFCLYNIMVLYNNSFSTDSCADTCYEWLFILYKLQLLIFIR